MSVPPFPEISEKYEILSTLGSGGMANVFLAVARGHAGFNKLVVLKVLRSELLPEPEYLKMFLDEARLAARLNHPNVVQTYEILDGADGAVLVMEYLEGQPLNLIMERAPLCDALSLEMRLRVVCDALTGLHYAHELRDYDGAPLDLVHRDVSPDNIHVTVDGQVKVLDFGIARARCITSNTRTGVTKGKLRYMAPEQLRGGAVDRRADVYAMGMVLWELATGRRAWAGKSDVEVMNRVLNEGMPLASEVSPGVLPSLDGIIKRALGREAAERQVTALELQGDLERVLDELGGRVRSRQIGGVVAALFADVHAERAHALERLLARASARGEAATLVHDVRAPLPSKALPRSPVTSSTARSAFASDRARPRTEERRPLTRRGGVALGAATLALLTLMELAVRVRAPARAPEDHAAAAPTASASRGVELDVEPPAAAPRELRAPEVRVVVRASPARAVVLIDDVVVSGAPAARTFPGDARLHAVRVECAGYRAWTSRVAFDGNVDLAVSLELAPALAAQAKRAPPSPSSASEAPPSPPPPPRAPRELDPGLPW